MSHIGCGIDGWGYCFNVLDAYTRRWVAYIFDTTATARTTIQSIHRRKRPEPEDQDRQRPQYGSREFRKSMQTPGLKHEFIWKNTPEQYGYVKFFRGTLKREYIWPHDFANYQQAEAVISEAFRDYNRNRLHSALKYVPPDEFLASWEAAHK